MRFILLLALLGPVWSLDFAAVTQATADAPRMQLTFVQEKHLALLDQPVRSEGLIQMSRDQQAVRWAFGKDVVLLLRKERLRRYVKGVEEDLSRAPGAQVLGQQMQAMLAGDWTLLTQDFTVQHHEDGVSLTLQPTLAAIKPYISEIMLRFRADLRAPERIQFTSSSGDKTVYNFAPPKFPAELAAEIFTAP